MVTDTVASRAGIPESPAFFRTRVCEMLWMTGIGAEGGVCPEGKGDDGRGAYRNSVKSVHVVDFRQSAQSLVARGCRDAGAGGSMEWFGARGQGCRKM